MVLRRGFAPRGQLVNRSQRRKTAWVPGPGSTDALPISSSVASFVGGGVVAGVEALTVVRTRGELLITLVNATTVLDGFRGAFGIGVVSLPAFTAGIASVPTPIAEQDDENWLYHRYFTVFAGSGPSETFGNAGSPVLRVEVDSKGMRKFGTDRVIYAAVEVVEVGTAILDVSFNSRMLVKLS